MGLLRLRSPLSHAWVERPASARQAAFKARAPKVGGREGWGCGPTGGGWAGVGCRPRQEPGRVSRVWVKVAGWES